MPIGQDSGVHGGAAVLKPMEAARGPRRSRRAEGAGVRNGKKQGQSAPGAGNAGRLEPE